MSTGLNPPRTCRVCNAVNPPGATFCIYCGGALEARPATYLPCPACGEPNPAGARFCMGCGRAFGASGSLPPSTGAAGVGPLPPPLPTWTSPGPPASEVAQFYDEEQAKAKDRTITGVTLLIVAFLLNWIPYVNFLGDLLAFIAIILLFLGRWGFDDRHHAFVLGGIVLLVIVVLGVFITALAFVAGVVQDAQTTTSLSQLTGPLQSQIDTFLVATAVFGALSGFAYVLIPYALANSTTRGLLWVALVAQISISVIVLALSLPLVNNAVAQATSGSTFDPGPVNDLQSTARVLGLLNIVPSLLFAWAYYRVRTAALAYD